MDAAKQKVRAAAAHKKEEERKAKEKEGTSSSVPKAISKGSTKRKVDGEDDRLPKKVAVTLGDAHPKKSPPKPGPGTGKGMMTSTSPVIRRPCCLLTHKDYAVEEVKTLIKPTTVDPCAKLGTKELGESALFDLTLVSLLPWLILSIFFFFTDDYTVLQALVRVKALQDRCVAKEGVDTMVRKHNSNLLDQQKQYKEALHTLNVELKETREKLEAAGSRSKELEEELTTLRKQVEKAKADAVQEFKRRNHTLILVLTIMALGLMIASSKSRQPS